MSARRTGEAAHDPADRSRVLPRDCDADAVWWWWQLLEARGATDKERRGYFQPLSDVISGEDAAAISLSVAPPKQRDARPWSPVFPHRDELFE